MLKFLHSYLKCLFFPFFLFFFPLFYLFVYTAYLTVHRNLNFCSSSSLSPSLRPEHKPQIHMQMQTLRAQDIGRRFVGT